MCRTRRRRFCAVTTYRPMTAASMINPPNRLYSRNFTAALDLMFAAEPTDQEVHRDEHGLEEDVEQQHVQRDERDHDHALDGQGQRQVGVGGAAPQADLVVGVVPARDDQQRHQHRGEHDERQRDAVDAEDVAGAERRYPGVGFDELVLLAAGSKSTASMTAITSTATETSSANHFASARPVAGISITSAAPSIGTAHRMVSHGSRGHHSCTARITATTSAAPANIDSA